jgi:hypothetical protein
LFSDPSVSRTRHLPFSRGGVNTRMLKNPVFNGMSFVNIIKFCFGDIQLFPLARGGVNTRMLKTSIFNSNCI